MNCVNCGDQPFGIGKLLRYQLTAGNAENRFKCDHCNTFLLKKSSSLSERLKRVISIFAVTIAAIVLYYFTSEYLFGESRSYIWLAYSISYIAVFVFLVSKLDLRFISFEKDSSPEPVLIMKIRKPGWMVFSAWLIVSILLMAYYLNAIEPMFTDPQWGGIVFILFLGLLLGIGGFLLKYYSKKIPA